MQKIKVRCPNCESSLRVNRDLAGKMVKCKCGSTFRIGSVRQQASQVSPKVKFRCGSCSQMMQSDARNVGQQITCGCGASIVIADGGALPTAQPVIQEPVEPMLIAELVPDDHELEHEYQMRDPAPDLFATDHQDPLGNQKTYSSIERKQPQRPRGKVHRAPPVTTIFFVFFFGGISLLIFVMAMVGLVLGGPPLVSLLMLCMASGAAAITARIATYRVVVSPRSIEIKSIFGTRRIILSEVAYVEIHQSYGKYGTRGGKTWTFMGRGGDSILGYVGGNLGGYQELEAWIKRRFKCKTTHHK